MEPTKKQFKPQNLRTILAVALVLVLLLGAAGFYFGITAIREYAVQVNNRTADAEASGKQVQSLQTLRDQLSKSSSLIEKADQLFATPDSYQSQVLNDLNRYADTAGLSIATTTFSQAAEGGPQSVTVTLKQPVAYNNLIMFLHYVEGNLPKLQVSSIALGRPGSGGAANVKTDAIKIDISVR